tara:strand:+ start:7855 stop:8673 length:819 start_codon:yes stop_codon:yes gene_type:complete
MANDSAVVTLDSLKEHRHSFRKLGFSKISGFLPLDYIHYLESCVDDIIDQFKSASSEMEEAVVSYGSSWIFLENIFRYSDDLRTVLSAGPLVDLASFFLEADDVQLLRDQTYYKIGPAQETPWHQDGLFVPDDNLKSVTFWIPFHNIDQSMSPMSYVNGSHHWCYLGDMLDRFHDFNTFEAVLKTQGMNITTFDSLLCGDLLIHDTWAMHGTPAMLPNSSRKAIVLVYAKSPIQLNSVNELPSCHRNLRAQASVIRQANKISFHNTLKCYER